MNSSSTIKNSTTIALISGAIAGQSVDLILFPLDTIKTRLQSELGFWKAGGFGRIYSGLSSTFAGAAPNAAIFFLTYETAKRNIGPLIGHENSLTHASAACIGEIAACTIRVPVEVVKQRAQATHVPSWTVFKEIISGPRGAYGLYRGFFSTTLREIPFSLIQFPLWEFLKQKSSFYFPDTNSLVLSTFCGAIAGGVAAGITTPLDVAKTRIMLAKDGTEVARGQVFYVLKQVHLNRGIKGLFAGVLPRVTWISLGGAIFLGGYDLSSHFLRDYL